MDLQEIRNRYNLIDFVTKEGVNLKKYKDYYMGFCPFHDNKNTPSFAVKCYHFKCFSCLKSGDIFDFLKFLKGYSIQESVKYLSVGTATYTPYEIKNLLRQEKERVMGKWIDNATNILKNYESGKDLVNEWIRYNPLISEKIIRDNHLGIGYLPGQSEKRLIVPLMIQNEILGFRGRSIGDSEIKWIMAKGGAVTSFLYNGSCLLNGIDSPDIKARVQKELVLGNSTIKARVKNLVIIENAVDTILIPKEWERDFSFVATLSMNYWLSEWTKAIQIANPKNVLIAFDRPKETNKEQTDNAINRVISELKNAGIESARFVYPKQWGCKDFGEVLKLTTMAYNQ